MVVRERLEETEPKASKKRIENIIDACLDPNLFGPWFKDMSNWVAWFAFLRTAFGLELKKEHRIIYEQCTKRSEAPTQQFDEIWLVIGRRGGKSRVLALIAVFMACFFDWTPYLAPGERATIVIIATDRRQARIVLRYIRAFLEGVPMLRDMVEVFKAESFDLDGQVTIEVHTATFRGVRGYAIPCAIMDEIAFFRSENSFNPDYEIIEAVRPGMASMPKPILVCASSPHARRGELYKNYKKYFGKNDPNILVWQAPTKRMNPTISQKVIDAAYARDPSKAAAEFGAVFRTDVETYVKEEALIACTIPGRMELPPSSEHNYKAFTDPSGGSEDSFSLAIAHREGDKAVLDLLREIKPPFSPDDVTKDYCNIIKRYHTSYVMGDRYAGEWPRERFRKHGVIYEVCTKVKSDIYRDLLPLINSTTAELLDDPILFNQALGLERRTGRGRGDSIDHAPGAHDDIINAGAGALVMVTGMGPIDVW